MEARTRTRAAWATALAAGGLIAAGVAQAGPAAAAPKCALKVTAVFADNLQEDSAGFDDIWVKVGGKWFPSYFNSSRIHENEIQLAPILNYPQNTGAPGTTLPLELWEDDAWPAANDALGGKIVGLPGNCDTNPSGNQVVVFENAAYRYVINYNIGPA